MNVYQELQLNQAGSKALIRACSDKKEKQKHMLIYIAKVFLTLIFCIFFVSIFTKIFGAKNSVAGVVVLLCVMVFRQADLGLKASHSAFIMMGIFGIFAIGPRLSNMVSLWMAFFINTICILGLLILGCHNILMSNHATFVLSYLLLLGNDVSGQDYVMRVYGLAAGGIITAFILYHNHYKIAYKRSFKNLFLEFHLTSARTKWQIRMALGISLAMLVGNIVQIPRVMWIGIAAMSVLQPFSEDLKKRAKARIPGTFMGGALFLVLTQIIPKEYISLLGMAGGIGVGFSATYLWQTMFNSLGALSTVMGIYGIIGVILLRIVTNVFGVLFSIVFDKIFNSMIDCFLHRTDKNTILYNN